MYVHIHPYANMQIQINKQINIYIYTYISHVHIPIYIYLDMCVPVYRYAHTHTCSFYHTCLRVIVCQPQLFPNSVAAQGSQHERGDLVAGPADEVQRQPGSGFPGCALRVQGCRPGLYQGWTWGSIYVLHYSPYQKSLSLLDPCPSVLPRHVWASRITNSMAPYSYDIAAVSNTLEIQRPQMPPWYIPRPYRGYIL